jgi:hypothetical protein
MMTEGSVSIWFFIGVLLLVYGILITGAGIYGLSHPPNVQLANLHAGVWWGALLIILGLVYGYAFFPGRKAKGE